MEIPMISADTSLSRMAIKARPILERVMFFAPHIRIIARTKRNKK